MPAFFQRIRKKQLYNSVSFSNMWCPAARSMWHVCSRYKTVSVCYCYSVLCTNSCLIRLRHLNLHMGVWSCQMSKGRDVQVKIYYNSTNYLVCLHPYSKIESSLHILWIKRINGKTTHKFVYYFLLVVTLI